MDFILLEKMRVDIGNDSTIETFGLSDPDTSNNIAMLKARTLLAYLWDKNKLATIEAVDHPEWTVFINRYVADTFHLDVEVPDEVRAVIPIKFDEPSWKQPGIILVRNTVEDKSILLDSFLTSSIKWLRNKPKEMKMLDAIWGNA